MTERMKIEVLEVKERQQVGSKGAIKLAFKGKVEGKELWFFTFRSSLFDTIESSKIIDCEVDTSEREYDGNKYTDRKVNQIFIDGKPIGGQKDYKGSRGKSPEELELSRRAFALSYAKDLVVADRISVDKILDYATGFSNWLSGESKEVKPEPKKAKPKQEDTQGEDTEEPTINTIQAFLNWVASHGKAKDGTPFDKRWVESNFGFTEQEMKDKPYECYLAVKNEMMNW